MPYSQDRTEKVDFSISRNKGEKSHSITANNKGKIRKEPEYQGIKTFYATEHTVKVLQTEQKEQYLNFETISILLT